MVHGFFSAYHKVIAVAIVVALLRYCNSWKSDNFRGSNQERKLRTNTINEAKKIESNNFTRGNRERSNIAIAILENWIIGILYIISSFRVV